jgi:hypothetical protein
MIENVKRNDNRSKEGEWFQAGARSLLYSGS